ILVHFPSGRVTCPVAIRCQLVARGLGKLVAGPTTMLNLHAPTPERWLHQVIGNLDLLLIDHAHCEKKAAGVAMNLLFSYVEHAELTQAMTEIVQEELDHFHQVRALLARRGIRFFKPPPSRYGERLHELVGKQEPQRAVDRL